MHTFTSFSHKSVHRATLLRPGTSFSVVAVVVGHSQKYDLETIYMIYDTCTCVWMLDVDPLRCTILFIVWRGGEGAPRSVDHTRGYTGCRVPGAAACAGLGGSVVGGPRRALANHQLGQATKIKPAPLLHSHTGIQNISCTYPVAWSDRLRSQA
jgi:hypothetical protein